MTPRMTTTADAALAPLAALAAFARATPALLAERELLRRIDHKYVLDRARLGELFGALAAEYAVLPVGEGGAAIYRNLYFDTPELRCFHDHRRGRRIRHKVRIRHYPDRELSFLEVKTKRSESITDKQRRRIDFGREELDAADLAFLHEHAGQLTDALVPAVRVDYRRVLLFHPRLEERLTIDLALEAGREGARAELGALAIVEIKRAPGGGLPRTPAMRALAALGVRERSLSKYCAAMALIHPTVRHNRLRPALRVLHGAHAPHGQHALHAQHGQQALQGL
jgi:VTC domain